MLDGRAGAGSDRLKSMHLVLLQSHTTKRIKSPKPVLKIFSCTCVYFLASSSESSVHEPKVVPENGVLCHKCADMCTTSLLSLSLYCACHLLDVTQMVKG